MKLNKKLPLVFGLLLATMTVVAAGGIFSLYQELPATHADAGLRVAWISLGLLVATGGIGFGVGLWFSSTVVRQLGADPGDLAKAVGLMAEGDLSHSMDVRNGDKSSVLARLAQMQEQLNRVVGAVRTGADGVAIASSEIAQGNNDLSARTEQQAGSLEQTASAMEQLGATVKHNADNARMANQMARSASEVAAKGGEVVGQVVTTMEGINDSSRKIGDIIGTIDGIAFQTNILALNAAVEAARAGEQGRGFAVVASEVRSLAQRSAEAAREIKTLISASMERVEQGTDLVGQAGRTMGDIVSEIKRVTDIMGEISHASSEQSVGVTEVGQAMTQMDQSTQQNAALVEQSAAAAESLKNQAQQLVRAVSVFKLQGGGPLMPASVSAPAPSSPTAYKPATPTHAQTNKASAGPASMPAARPKAAEPAQSMVSSDDADWESF